jgi:hypothetical protein
MASISVKRGVEIVRANHRKTPDADILAAFL